MAVLAKTSLREEFDALKVRFEGLSGDMPEESRALFQAMLMLFEVLMAVFLEKRTPKNSANSGLPPSQTAREETAAGLPGAKGKGPPQQDLRSGNTRTVETVEVAAVKTCERCGEDLGAAPCGGHERRTEIDIVFEKTVRHVDAEIKRCPRCRTEARGRFPTSMSGPLQYGAGIKAYVLNLLVAQMVSLKRARQSVETLIGRTVSEATLLKYVLRLHHALAGWERSAVRQLLTMPVMHVDETSLRVDRKNHWIHVCAGGEVTLKFLHPRRGREAIDALGVIPRYGGVVVHDCWASYLAYDNCGHSLCGAHLLRELTFVVESNGYAWARNMKRLLQETCYRVSEQEQKKLSESAYKNLRKRYRNILTRGGKQLPPIPPRQNGKRGRIAKSDAHNLWERMKRHESAVLLFAKNPHVAFTNNRAERDLRMSKVKQKVSGCFRNRQYAEAYCRISSYLQTMANRGYNPLVAIQMALSDRAIENGGE